MRQTHDQEVRSSRYRFGDAVCCPEVQLRPRARGTFQVEATIHWHDWLQLPPSSITVELRNPQQEVAPEARAASRGQASPAPTPPSPREIASMALAVRCGNRQDANHEELLRSLVELANQAYTLSYIDLLPRQGLAQLLVPPSSFRQRLLPNRGDAAAALGTLQAWTSEQMAQDLTVGDGRGGEPAEGDDAAAEVAVLLATSRGQVVGFLKLCLEMCQSRVGHSDEQMEGQRRVGRVAALAVSIGRQGEGIASRLLREAERHCLAAEPPVRTLYIEYFRPHGDAAQHSIFGDDNGQPPPGTTHAERLHSWFADLGYTPTSTTRHDALQLGHLRVPSSRPLWLERCRKELSAASLNATNPRAGSRRRGRPGPVATSAQHYEVHWG